MVEENALAMVIEDHRDISALYCMVLEEAGFRTEAVRTGDKAILRLAEVAPALVTLDLSLPGAHGEEILHRIRSDARLAKTRVIVITAYGHLAESIRAQADLVLTKPVNLQMLSELVTRLYTDDDGEGPLPDAIDALSA